ncbi:MAG: beta-lactamase family protein [Nannocystaceae bacterium]|nr:beta-lactamase family protein [Nannocystaceae bacterium]
MCRSRIPSSCLLLLTTVLVGPLLGCHADKATESPQRSNGSAASIEFPAATPQEVGIPAEALELLSKRVQAMVDDEAIVGGELLVIKNRRLILQTAYGWKDREASEKLETDAVYCVRSMTKPLTGTAIQILIDEGRLRLDTPVHEVLPAFDGPQTRKITVEHLLTHTAGFPLSTITKPLDTYPDLAAVASEAAATPLLFEPGARFQYSDASADTLGAVVAELTGAPLEVFIQQRILDPLGMQDSHPLLGTDAPLRKRIPSAYSGGTAAWSKHWDPSESVMFPLFLASQSLYSTTTDYARFLTLWLDGGRVAGQQLVSAEAVERALTPNEPIPGGAAGFANLDSYYGQQWVVYATHEHDAPGPVVFGHSGSDGTHAWVWPEQDLIVLFFTQSRGTTAGLALERDLQQLLVDQVLDAPEPTVTPAELKAVAGLYWDETAPHAYYVITARERGLMLERPGRLRMMLKPGDQPGRYVHEAGAPVWVEFVRDEAGATSAMRTSFGGNLELDPRHVADPSLPSTASVIADVREAHGVEHLAQLGVVRLSGTVKLEKQGLEGRYSSLFDTDRLHSKAEIGGNEELAVVSGQQAWVQSTHVAPQELDGTRLAQALLDQVAVRYGDWTEHYESVEVLKRLEIKTRPVLLVRVVPKEGPGSTMVVDEQTGRLVHIDALAQIPGLGLVGVETDFGDFRDVDGLTLPFTTVSKYATPLIGKIISTVESAETGVRPPAGTFEAPNKH